jgi:hypothetical protein
MMNTLLKESASRPDIFVWKGKLALSDVRAWEQRLALRVPSDLAELWSLKGGADIFESETVLQPFGTVEEDLIEPESAARWARGLSRGYFVFHTGTWDSLFRAVDGQMFRGTADDPECQRYPSLDDWYKALRAEYGARYGLTV